MKHEKGTGDCSGNKEGRREGGGWAPMTTPPEMLGPLIKSIEQFRLGDGGGPASLIAYDADRFRNSAEQMRAIVDSWFKEEAEHARLLGCAVKRFGGRFIYSHWRFTAFCLCRRVLGVRFELQVPLLTGLVRTAYYRLLRADSPAKSLAQ